MGVFINFSAIALSYFYKSLKSNPRKILSMHLVESFIFVRLIEDCVRDLLLNNDHIHVVEQQMREAIKTGLKKDTHKDASVKCFPTYVRYI